MYSYQIELTINRPVEDVFKMATDIDRKKELVSGFESYSVIKGAKGQTGCVYRLYLKEIRGTTEILDELVHVKLNNEYHYKIQHKFFTGTYKISFIPSGQGTMLTVKGNVIMNRYKWLVKSFVFWMKVQQLGDLSRLKKLIESA